MSEDDFSDLVNSIDRLTDDISEISSQVDGVDSKVDSISSDLQDLKTEFQSFFSKYILNTELQLSETRIIAVRQKLEKEFGHYDEVRRHTTGILQAVDTSLVRQETIKYATEELMISTPRYWLTPCLIALASWVNNDQDHAQSAVMEGIRRNDEKTSLFFSLVCRRANRYNASRQWLDRYLSMQNPKALPIDMVVVIDAYSNGIFGPDIDGICIKRFRGWIESLSMAPGFEDKQRAQWKKALRSVGRSTPPDKDDYLEKYSPTWPKMVEALAGARIYQQIYDYFFTMFNEKVEPAAGMSVAIDNILNRLVSQYDEDELALKHEERFLSLVIEEQGNKKEAQRRFDLEKETTPGSVDFTQTLTNAAIHPAVVKSSRTCQRFSVALSKDWIINAFKQIKAENHLLVPHSIDFTIDQWSGSTIDGGNETELIASINGHVNQQLSKGISTIKLDGRNYIVVAIGGIIFIWGLTALNVIGLIIGAIGLGWFYYNYSKIAKKKQQVRAHFAKLESDMQKVVKALLAEVVDWRKVYADEDAKSQLVDSFLGDITPEQYVGCTYHPAKNVMMKK